MNNEVVLTAMQISDIKDKAKEVRRLFGIDDEVPIAKEIFMLLEKRNIILCEYPFEASQGSHTDATLTRFEANGESLVFIGLNTSLYYDQQIFALAHELYHFITQTGKAYTDEELENPLIEKMADRFAAELLLPATELERRVIKEFGKRSIDEARYLRTLRFIARLQSEWWMPYHAIVNRLHEEGYLNEYFDKYYEIDDRKESSIYCRIFQAINQESYLTLNKRTNRKGVSSVALETIILNYEEGRMSDDEFAELLCLFGKTPEEFGYDLNTSAEDLEELNDLFEGGD